MFKVGDRIKLPLPTVWCEVRDNRPMIWFKGTVVEANEKSFVANVWNKKHKLRIERLFCKNPGNAKLQKR